MSDFLKKKQARSHSTLHPTNHRLGRLDDMRCIPRTTKVFHQLKFEMDELSKKESKSIQLAAKKDTRSTVEQFSHLHLNPFHARGLAFAFPLNLYARVRRDSLKSNSNSRAIQFDRVSVRQASLRGWQQMHQQNGTQHNSISQKEDRLRAGSQKRLRPPQEQGRLAFLNPFRRRSKRRLIEA